MTDPQLDPEYTPAEAPPPRRSPWTSCLLGCLVMLGVAIVVAVVAGIWISRNWRDWASSAAEQVIHENIEATNLPPQEKQEIKAELERVTVAFREGQLSNEQAVRIMEELSNSPLFAMFVVSTVEKQYLVNSGLSEEEIAEGRITLQRFVRGAADGRIQQQAVDDVMTHIADRQPDGNWELRESVSDDALRAALADAKRHADEAGIDEQPEDIDPSEEFKRIIDDAMSEP